METIRTIPEAKAKMEKSCKYYAVRLAAWENVKRLYKKNGEPFATLSKNFSGAKFIEKYGNRYIEVHFKDESGAYNYDNITLMRNAYKGLEEATTPDEVESRINAQIETYRNWLEIDKNGAKEIENQINNITPELEKIKEALKAAEETNTHYTIQAYVKSYLKIVF